MISFAEHEIRPAVAGAGGLIESNVRDCLGRGLSEIRQIQGHDGRIVVCAGGPSLCEAPAFVLNSRLNDQVLAVNGAYDYLADMGIVADFHMLLDPQEKVVEFVRRPSSHTVFLVASQCHPAVFDALEGYRVLIWHAYNDGQADGVFAEMGRKWLAVGGGVTVSLRALVVARVLGFRTMDVFGLDGSFGDQEHAYLQESAKHDPVKDVFCLGRMFRSTPGHILQFNNLMEMKPLLTDCEITLHGDGMMQHGWRVVEGMTLNAAVTS